MKMLTWLRKTWLTILFVVLYVAIAAATFRHSAIGFASIEGGSVVWGALSALAVDAGMALSATGLRRQRSMWLIIGLVASAIASTYTQWLYALSYSQAAQIAPGAAWLGNLALTVANFRIIVLPALLPTLSIVYAFASKSVGDAAPNPQRNGHDGQRCPYCQSTENRDGSPIRSLPGHLRWCAAYRKEKERERTR